MTQTIAPDGNALVWRALVVEVIRNLAIAHEAITTDDVWAAVDRLPAPPNRREMGIAVTMAQRAGLIEPTGTFIVSKRRACHGRPIAVWRTLRVLLHTTNATPVATYSLTLRKDVHA